MINNCGKYLLFDEIQLTHFRMLEHESWRIREDYWIWNGFEVIFAKQK